MTPPDEFPIGHWAGYLAAFDELMEGVKRRDPYAQSLARRRMTALLEQSPEYWRMLAADYAKRRPAA